LPQEHGVRLDRAVRAARDEIDGYRRAIVEGAFHAMQSKQMRYSSWQKQRGRPRKNA
jgi:hypothetical protein